MAFYPTYLLLDFSTTPLREEHGIPLAIMGVVVVFLALGLVAILIKVLTLIGGPPELLESSSPLPKASGDCSPETVAVIAAAVAVMIERPQRIVRIRGITPGEHDWSLEGRLQHHHSHRLPHTDAR